MAEQPSKSAPADSSSLTPDGRKEARRHVVGRAARARHARCRLSERRWRYLGGSCFDVRAARPSV